MPVHSMVMQTITYQLDGHCHDASNCRHVLNTKHMIILKIIGCEISAVKQADGHAKLHVQPDEWPRRSYKGCQVHMCTCTTHHTQMHICHAYGICVC